MANVRIPTEGPLADAEREDGQTRREALANGAKLVVGAGIGAQIMAATGAETAIADNLRSIASAAADKPGYGPLVRKGPMKVPQGFTVVQFGRRGDVMSDGIRTPRAHDGSAAFPTGKRDRVVHLRNHEEAGVGKSIGKRNAYDRIARGGVTASVFDTKNAELVEAGLVLNGTAVNCSGGATPWGSWLTCEETTVGKLRGYERDHGYVFEVPKGANGPVDPVPIKAMGRFLHEACAVDPRTGIVYMTEDEGPDGFYRYLPNHRGKLHRGGKLQMLCVKGRSKYDTVTKQKVGKRLPCEWVTIEDPDPKDAEQFPSRVYEQGRDKGAARFMGLEGCNWGQGSVWFTASEGGDVKRGQVWRYTPSKNLKKGTLQLVFESNDRSVLDQPDNICVSPRGGVILCEDGDGEDRDGGTNNLRVLTPKGKMETFAINARPLDLHEFGNEEKGWFGRSEWTGATYSPDGKWLFVNLQYPGTTYAITGPWQKGWA